MIRRDYILRMIEEFIQALSRVAALKKDGRWSEASSEVDDKLKKLTGFGVENVARFSETELLALLIQGEPTGAVREKAFLLTALLTDAADIAAVQGRDDEARLCRLKALHLLLDLLRREEVFEFPEFVPKVASLVADLQDEALPAQTNAMLMQHYERIGDFAKAEDALFALLDAAPEDMRIIDFGLSFYERLLAQSDETLAQGNLPRAEVDEGIVRLQRKREGMKSL